MQYACRTTFLSGVLGDVKSKKKVFRVRLHGRSWSVYSLKCRGKTIFRVIHRVNDKRKPKTFPSLIKARADAKNILLGIYAKEAVKIHLTADERADWKAALSALKPARIRSSLETVCQHDADLAQGFIDFQIG